jgi:hypothetical protein
MRHPIQAGQTAGHDLCDVLGLACVPEGPGVALYQAAAKAAESRVSASPRLHVVPNPAPGGAHELDPLVPDGTYTGIYVRHDLVALKMFKNAMRIFIRFRIVDPGEHQGAVLFRAYRVRPGRSRGTFVAPKRSKLFRTIAALYPSERMRGDRINVRAALKGRAVKLTARTVTTDSEQRPLPPNCRYSVVDELIGFETEGGTLDQ